MFPDSELTLQYLLMFDVFTYITEICDLFIFIIITISLLLLISGPSITICAQPQIDWVGN